MTVTLESGSGGGNEGGGGSGESATFTLVTATSELNGTDEYIFVFNDTYLATTVSSKTLGVVNGKVSVSGNTATIANMTDVKTFTFPSDESNFEIKYFGENTYIGGGSKVDVTATNTPTAYPITFDNGSAKIAGSASNRYLSFNNEASVKWYDTSSNSSNTYPKIYKKSNDVTPPTPKTPVTLTYSASSVTITQGDTFTAPTLTVTPEAATSSVTYNSSNTAVASVNASGIVSLGSATGSTTITASIPATDATYTATPASYTLTVNAASSTDPGDANTFTLVTNVSELNGTDEYIILYDTDKAADAVSGSALTLVSGFVTVSGSTATVSDLSAVRTFKFPSAETSGKYNILGTNGNYVGYSGTNKTDVNTIKKDVEISINSSTNEVSFLMPGTSRYLISSSGTVKWYSTASSNSYTYPKVYKKSSGVNPPATKTPVTLSFSETTVTCEQGQTPTAPTLNVTPEVAREAVVYTSSNTDVASVNPSTGAVTLGSATGTTTITASIPESDENYTATPASYTLTVTEATPSYAEDATFDFTKPNELDPTVSAPATNGNGTKINGKTFTSGEVTLSLAKNGASTDCYLWKTKTGTELRVYKKATITIAAKTGYKITGISLNKNNNDAAFSVSPGLLSTKNGVITWNPGSTPDPITSVVLTCTTNAQVPSITVTYEPLTPPTQVATPSVTVSGTPTEEWVNAVKYYTNAINLQFACDTEGVTYHYSTDDGATYTPLTGNTLSLNEPATLKVKATKEGLDESPVVTAGPYRFTPATPELTATKDDETKFYSVTITSATTGASIKYSLDGGTTWLDYPDGGFTVTAYGETTVTAKAVYSAYNPAESQTDDVHFTIFDPLDIMHFELATDPTTLRADDKVIIVALNADKAMAPYASGDDFCRTAEITKIVEDNNAINLQPDQEAVEIFTLVAHTNGENNFWRFAPEYTKVNGYLYATGNSNNMKVGTPADEKTGGNRSNATLSTIDGTPGAMKITFSEATKNTIRFNNDRFSCYTETSCDPVALYVLTSNKDQVARPVISMPEGIYDEGELSEGVTLTCATEGALIRYTTDGQNARLYGDNYTTGTVIPVTDCTTIRAYAYMPDDSMFPSASLIATYHVFTGNKVFTRVTDEDMKYLGVGDEVIIVASPTDDNHYFALGTTQITHDGSKCREAVALGENAVDADGNLTLTTKAVQPLILLSGLDRTTDYDWRLYASGTLDEGEPGAVLDGYLFSEGAANSLGTQRIDDPDSPDMPNADVTFHTLASTNIGNEYGGVTVEFGATSGQENFPNYMGLRKVADGDYHFNCFTLDQIDAEGSDIYHVSIFKAYSTTISGMPAISPAGGDAIYEEGDLVTLTTRDPDAVIYYTLDGTTPTTESVIYTDPIRLTGSCTVKAFAVSAGMTASPVAEQSYRVRFTQVFELVTTGTKLNEGDEIIIVNATPYQDEDLSDTEPTRYYALTDVIANGYHVAVELNPVDTPEGKPHRLALTQIDGETLPLDANGTSHDHIVVAKLELDGSGSEASTVRPWLLKYGKEYLYSITEKQLGTKELPENIEERDGINVGITIADGTDYDVNKIGQNPNTSLISNKATAVFNKKDGGFTALRFNPTGNFIHFNAYGYDYDNDTPNMNTYPVSIYRAVDRIEIPSLTIYPTDIAQTKATGVQTYEEDGTAAGRSFFYNPVKIVIKENLHTNINATLKYAWSKTVQNAPVSSEYTVVEGSEIVIELDGFMASVNGNPAVSIADKSKYTDFMETVIRAMSELGDQNSPSLPRTIHFRTVAPGIEPHDAVGTTRDLDLIRPEFYTVGADIWYSIDGNDPVPGAENSTLVTKGADRVMATITVPTGSTVKVGAFRPGFEPDITTYTENTYYPGARPMQLVELTAAGKAALGTTAKYLTYRTAADFAKYDDAHYYTVDPVYDTEAVTGIADINLTQVATANAQAVFANPANFRWTADYYVFALNGSKFESKVTGLQEGWKVSVQDSEGADIEAHKTNLTIGSEPVDYYGAILQRKGSLGQNTVMSHLTYNANGGHNTASPAAKITPAMPRPFNLKYSYVAVRDNAEDYTRTEDFEFETGSSIPGHESDVNTLVFPADQFTLRHFNCVFEFTRPNVCLDIIDNYDIVYDVAVITYSDVDDLHGYYGDPVRGTDETHTYTFVVNDVHPNEAINPTLFINKVYYIPNGDSDGYSLLEANYGDTNSGLYRQSLEAANTVSAVAPNLGFVIGYSNNADTTVDWVIRSHTEVTNPEVSAHTNDEAVVGAPFVYHLEAYYPLGEAGSDHYFSHGTLIQHDAEHCSTSAATPDENDPFYYLTIGQGYANKSQYPHIYLTPIYFFKRLPESSISEVGLLEDYTHWFESGSSAPQQAPRRVSGIHDESNPLIIRGSVPGVFKVENTTVTGIEEVSAEPETDAIYFTINGVQVRADRLAPGIYIRLKGNAVSKILVK